MNADKIMKEKFTNDDTSPEALLYKAVGANLASLDFETRKAFSEKYKEQTATVKKSKWGKTVFTFGVFAVIIGFILWFWGKLNQHDKKVKDGL